MKITPQPTVPQSDKVQKNFFSEKFGEILQNLPAFKTEFTEEYELLLMCGDYAGVVYVKFKACKDTVPEILQKAETLRLNYPVLKNHEICLGLVALSFEEDTEEECRQEGIALIREIDGRVVIEDEYLKAHLCVIEKNHVNLPL